MKTLIVIAFALLVVLQVWSLPSEREDVQLDDDTSGESARVKREFDFGKDFTIPPQLQKIQNNLTDFAKKIGDSVRDRFGQKD